MTTPLDSKARRELYALLTRLFAVEVDAALYHALATQDSLGLIDTTLRAMGEEAALEALAVEFCRLFIGPQPLCAPYASAYHGEALLGGRARTRLEVFLQRIDFRYDAAVARIASPDHIAVALAVLAYLSAREDMAAATHEFLRDHVLAWVPAYCEGIVTAAAMGFYRTTARLTLALLAEETSAMASHVP